MRRNETSRQATIESLSRDVLRLSQLLTKERASLPQAYLRDRGLREAYAAYYLPVNSTKIALPLRELDRHPSGILRKDRLRVLDIGCGPGTSLLGVMTFFDEQPVRPALAFTAVDQVAENLRIAETFFQGHRGASAVSATLKTLHGNLETGIGAPEGPFDLVILSNVLSELHAQQSERLRLRAGIVQGIMERLLDGNGSCIIIEPALRETGRELLQVRDTLQQCGFRVYSPCLRNGPCPALEQPKDWCHEDRNWEPPSTVREIDSRIGLRKDSLKFSYLVVRRDGKILADCVEAGAWRVVSEPIVTKGKRELFLCGNGGRVRTVRLDKDADQGNAAFSGLARGSIVRLEGAFPEPGRVKVVRGTIVEIDANSTAGETDRLVK